MGGMGGMGGMRGIGGVAGMGGGGGMLAGLGFGSSNSMMGDPLGHNTVSLKTQRSLPPLGSDRLIIPTSSRVTRCAGYGRLRCARFQSTEDECRRCHHCGKAPHAGWWVYKYARRV